MVERIADPLLAGVYGGTADELSVQSVLPRFAEIEAKQGSLGRALIATRKLRPAGQVPPLFTSLMSGMQQLTDALLVKIPESSRRINTPVIEVKSESGRWLVVSNGRRTEEFDAVIISTPAYCAAEILLQANPDLAAELNAIPYSSSITVTVAFDSAVRAGLLPGFGFLVPHAENRRLLAATFVHNKFPGRAPDDIALIRCFLGGSKDEQALHLSDDEVRQIVLTELRQILGIAADPLFIRTYKWRQAMALYTVGHKVRMDRIRNLTAAMPGLALAGNAYRGIGVPDCVRSGSEAARAILRHLGIAPDVTAGPAGEKG
jgi:oxygen-dependent protoporphyrinogen oxidase